jgi:hypothetical protein
VSNTRVAGGWLAAELEQVNFKTCFKSGEMKSTVRSFDKYRRVVLWSDASSVSDSDRVVVLQTNINYNKHTALTH